MTPLQHAAPPSPPLMPRHGTTWHRTPWLAPLAVMAAAIGFGLNPYFATQAFAAGVHPIAAATVRVMIFMAALSPWARHLRAWKRESLIVAFGGAVSMIGFAGFFVSLQHAPVAAVTVIYYSYPVVVVALSALIWKRRLRIWEVAVCATVLTGVILAVGPIGLSPQHAAALAPAVVAPVGWAIYLVILSGPAAAMPTLPKIFAGTVGGVTVLLPIALVTTHGHLLPVTRAAFTSMAWLTLCTLAIPVVLMTWGSARAGERTTAMIGSFEFVVAVAAGWLLMGQHLSAVQVLGATLVVCAALYAARHGGDGTRRHPATPAN